MRNSLGGVSYWGRGGIWGKGIGLGVMGEVSYKVIGVGEEMQEKSGGCGCWGRLMEGYAMGRNDGEWKKLC